MPTRQQTRLKGIKSASPRQESVYAIHSTGECGHQLRNRPIHQRKSGALEGKHVIQVVTQEQIRDILIPSHETNVHPTLWPRKELERIESKARLKSFEDHQEEMKRQEAERQKLQEGSERRKKILQEIDKAKLAKGKQPEALVEDFSRILDRAFLAKQEQEEEVKKANRLILATKCHVIRDAQIAEKAEIAKEIKNEDLKLEKIMLEEAKKALEEQGKKQEQVKVLSQRHSNELRKQLEQKEMIRLKEAERIEEEAKRLKQAQLVIKMDEAEKERQRAERRGKIRKDLQKAKELSTYFKQLEFEEQRMAELKVAEYMRQKREREAQYQLEQRIAKEAKDAEFYRLLQIQQKILDTKSHREAMVLRRGQEQVEREYRRREKEAAIKKREMEKEISKARAIQLEETKRQRALEIARDELDYKTSVEKFKQEEKRELESEKEKLIEKEKYREEIMRQMCEKERQRKEQEQQAKKDFLAAIEAEKNREKVIKNVIAMKIKQMKDNNIPERFVKDVEKQLNVKVE